MKSEHIRQDKTKGTVIQLRATLEEKEKIVSLAKEAGMTVTDFIKASTLNKSPRIRKANFDREILIRLLAELGKVGSNVNQIAKVMNAEKKTTYSVSVKETVIVRVLGQITTISSSILKHLEHGSEG